MLELIGCIVYCSRRYQKKGRRDNVNRVEVAERESMARYKILSEGCDSKNRLFKIF